jgi:hypothetical protein
MRKILSAFVVIAGVAFGQTTIRINVGGEPTGMYSGDTVCGGTVFPVPGQAGIYGTLKYGLAGAPFSCDVPAPNGSCIVTLDLVENRPAGPNPATDSAIGTRLFTATVQGIVSAAIDIFAAAGALTPYQLTLPAQVTDGHLRIVFAATKGNASLAGLDVLCTPAPPPTLGVPCQSLTPSDGVALVINLPDGSCLPVSLLAAPGFVAQNIQAIRLDNGKVQSIFTTLTPVAQ